MKLERFFRPRWIVLYVAVGYTAYLGVQLSRSYLGTKHDIERIRHIVASEELILALNSELDRLSRSVQNLQLPDYDAAHVFWEQVEILDIAGADSVVIDAPATANTFAVREQNWALSTAKQMKSVDLSMWQPLLSELEYFDHAKFYFIDGRFTDGSFHEFRSRVGFKGLAKLHSGKWIGIRARQDVTWRPDAAASDSRWLVAGWRMQELQAQERSAMLFRETLNAALPDADQLRKARISEHEEATREYYRSGASSLPWRFFSPISANQRPGISVVDVDRDGHDDLYVMVRRGPNQLFHNRGDGTFEEVASQWGLDIRDYCSCGIFADFDNDGDADLMLGRSIERSMYLENTGRRFEQRQVSDQTDTLPFLVASMSAADYNGDGLLDVYFCTYRPAVLESIVADETQANDEPGDTTSSDGQLGTGGIDDVAQQSQQWTDEFLSPMQARKYMRRARESQDTEDQFGRILDQVGPPNVLLVNRGQGRFEVAPESPQLELWRNTLQATWSDFDEDGDPDLYVANDWAPDHLFRNDGGHRFVDMSRELGITEFGFAMGVSWGDYDRDGRQDLYVSNMYSKAGRRITSQIAELNPDYGRSVDGNYLYRNTSQGFQLVSGLEPPGLTVAEAGWSWGGQFADFDNDGFLDLYVLSGYFTAPDEFASQVDL